MARRTTKPRIKCEICGKSYTKTSLSWHNREVHGIYVRGPKANKQPAGNGAGVELMTEIAQRDSSNGRATPVPTALADFEIVDMVVLRNRRTGELWVMERLHA